MALVQKSFSDIITFSRSSNATRVGPTGLVEYAPHNLLTYSQDFSNAAWDKGSGYTLTANAIAAPDGTVTADLFIRGSTLSYAWLSQTVVGNASQPITFSCWVRTVSGASSIALVISDVAIASAGSSYLSIDTTWQRLSFSITAGQLSNTGAIGVGFTMSSGQSAYFWGAQLSVGPYALDYTPTTSAAVYGPRFDYDGSGVTIVEPVSRNLVLYSEDFTNAAWTKTDCTASANATTSPDGTVTADQITEVLNTSNNLFNTTLYANSAGQAMSASVFLKYLSRRYVQVVCGGAADGFGCVVDLVGKTITATGTKGSSTYSSSTIIELANGWVRVTVSGILASSNTGYIALRSSDASTWPAGAYPAVTGQNAYYVWGAQLEVGSTATGYMVSGATNGFRAVPVVSGSATARGLLVEESRTNLATYSEQFDNAAWIKLNASVTANASTSPNGTVSAALLIPNTSSSNQHGVYQTSSATAGAAYTQSIFAKAAGYNWLFMTEGNNVTAQASFNLATGVVGTVTGTGSPSATITSVGNGWYRCTLTYTPVATSQNIQIRAANADAGPTFAGNGTSGIYIWGAQLEAGSFATSLIPTLASTVTRSADVASVNTLSPWWNATESTIYSEFDTFSTNDAFPYALGTKNNNEVDVYRIGSNGNVATLMFTSTVLQNNSTIATGTALNATIKAAYAIKANDLAGSANGGAAVTDTTATLPSVSTLYLGARDDGTGPLNGHLRRLAVYPRRLTNAELQALTA